MKILPGSQIHMSHGQNSSSPFKRDPTKTMERMLKGDLTIAHVSREDSQARDFVGAAGTRRPCSQGLMLFRFIYELGFKLVHIYTVVSEEHCLRITRFKGPDAMYLACSRDPVSQALFASEVLKVAPAMAAGRDMWMIHA